MSRSKNPPHENNGRLGESRTYSTTTVALGSFAAGSLVTAAGFGIYGIINPDPFRYSTAVATTIDTTTAAAPNSDPVAVGAFVEVAFHTPEPVALSDAISNVTMRFYEGGIVGYDDPAGRHAYKVQCHDPARRAGDIAVTSTDVVCDFSIYKDGFIPAND